MLLDTANPYTQSVIQQCTALCTVSQRPEHPTAAVGEEPEVEPDLTPPGMANPTRKLRQGLPGALKLAEVQDTLAETYWAYAGRLQHTLQHVLGSLLLRISGFTSAWLGQYKGTKHSEKSLQHIWTEQYFWEIWEVWEQRSEPHFSPCSAIGSWSCFLNDFLSVILKLKSSWYEYTPYMESYTFKNNWHQCFFQIGKLHHASTTALTNLNCSDTNIYSDKEVSRELNDTLHQPRWGRSAKFQLLSTSNTILLTFPLPGDQLYHRSQLGVQQSHQLLPKGHIKQRAQSSSTYSRNVHLCYNWFTGMCAANTREHKLYLEHTLTQAWLCWRRGWQHISKNIFSFSLKRDFLSQPALFIQCRRVTGFKNTMTHACLDVDKLCAVTEDVWKKCQEGLSTVLWRYGEVIATVLISESS